MMTRRICVTGANGLAGRAVVRDLLEHGYDVAATDIVARFGEDDVLRADLTDYGQAVEALTAADAVVHLANIPAPGLATPAVTFNANMTMNFNVFHAAAKLKLSRVVWASSETTLGLPFDVPPRYAPVDEEHYPVPASTYALSKGPARRSPGRSPAGRASRRGAAVLQHLGTEVLRGVPVLLGRSAAAQVEPVGLHRRAGCGASLPARAGGRR